MVQKRTQQIKAYKIDIARTSKDGSFRCPACGMKISPDDQSEANYVIHDIEMKNDELYEVIICCKRCFSLIHLNGFLEIFKNSQNARVFINHI